MGLLRENGLVVEYGHAEQGIKKGFLTTNKEAIFDVHAKNLRVDICSFI